MLIGVAIFNPLIALIVLNSLPFEIIAKAKDFLLADAGLALGGQLFRYLIVSDAFLVLSGAVLTSYVGISGLISRMAADGCLPNFLTKENKKQAYPRIILTFFLLCSSILLLTRGNLLSLAGVYTIAFLGVMTLFAFGNLILRETRPELKRTYHAPVLFVILALFSTLVGIIGNIKIDPRNLIFFACYFIPSVIIVLFVIYQDYLMRFALRLTKRILFINHYLHRKFEDLIEGKFIVFVHEARDIYQILHYINKNETGRKVIMVHCKDPHKGEYREIKEVLPHLQKAGVYPHLNVSLIYKPQTFGPEMIEKVSREFRVRKNRILIGSVRKEHPFDFADFGGVRIIL
jgi:hypothetical protein